MPSPIHREYIRDDPNSKAVVLFIHGILGTPNHFRDFVSMVPPGYAVHNMLLDGHGGAARAFSKSSLSQWKRSVLEKIDDLSNRYDRIMIVAHSLGALLAIDGAIHFPQKVKQLFLIAVPLKISPKPPVVSTSLKIAFNRVKPNDAIAMAAKAAYGMEPAKGLHEYLGWAPRFLELLRESKRVRHIVSSLAVPTTVFQSQKDELVSPKSREYFRGNAQISVQILPNSRHYDYDSDDYAAMLKAFSHLLRPE